MGKAKQCRVICVTSSELRETPEVQALEAKGHTILAWEACGNLTQPDLILGANCRMVTKETVKYVALALRELGKVKPVLEEVEVVAESQPVEEEEGEDE